MIFWELAGEIKFFNVRYLFEVFWGLAEELGRVKSHLEEVSFLAEFCSQVKFVLMSKHHSIVLMYNNDKAMVK